MSKKTHQPRKKHGQITVEKTYFKYTDSEIIDLILRNPGYGIRRFVKELYPHSSHSSNIIHRIILISNEIREETGVDLYDILQDPTFSTKVTEEEYKKITGKSKVPLHHGRATGGRPSKISDSFGQGSRKYRTSRNIPLPPQEFDWGSNQAESERNPRITGDSLDSEEE